MSANSRDDVNDENKAQTIIGKEKLAGGQLGDFSYGTRAATKRNALGDVSNIQAKVLAFPNEGNYSSRQDCKD